MARDPSGQKIDPANTAREITDRLRPPATPAPATAFKLIAEALKLDRPLLFFDLESTGTDAMADRIVEIATLSVRPDGTSVAWSSLINPERPIPPEATAVHKITDDMVKDAPRFYDVAPKLIRPFTQCALAGFNIRRFDLNLLAAEFRRVRLAFEPEDATVVDVMELFYRMEPRDLAGAARFYLRETHDGAHRGGADVEMTARVLWAQLERYGNAIPRGAEGLDRFGRDPHPDDVDREGKFRWDARGRACITFGKHTGRPVEALPQDYLRWLSDQPFATSTRKVIDAARRGVPIDRETWNAPPPAKEDDL